MVSAAQTFKSRENREMNMKQETYELQLNKQLQNNEDLERRRSSLWVGINCDETKQHNDQNVPAGLKIASFHLTLDGNSFLICFLGFVLERRQEFDCLSFSYLIYLCWSYRGKLQSSFAYKPKEKWDERFVVWVIGRLHRN